MIGTLRCSLVSLIGIVWLHPAKVSQLELQHHLNVGKYNSLMHIPSLGSSQISDQMSLFSGRKSPQAAFPQHGGYQDQNQQQNR